MSVTTPSFSSSYQKGEKSIHVHKLLGAFKSRRGAGWSCLILAFVFQVVALVLLIRDITQVRNNSEAVSTYITQNLPNSTLTLGTRPSRPVCSLDFAFQSAAQPALVRKSDFDPIIIKVILLVASTLFCAVGMAILGKNPFVP
jgi:hypothetical protein